MDKIIDYLNGELSESEKLAFEEKLESDNAFRKLFEKEKQFWSLMADIEVPEIDKKVKNNFMNSLDLYIEASQVKSKVSWFEKLKSVWDTQLKLSYALTLLCLGLGISFWINKQQKDEISNLATKVSDMKQDMVLSLIENPSAAERLRAVSLTSEMKTVDDAVIEALFSTLNNDSNDNVRLMTLEALAELADNPKVREGLVKSIVKQTSPLLQTAMADVMLRLQEKSAVKPLEKVLKRNGLDTTVKDKLEETIQKITV